MTFRSSVFAVLLAISTWGCSSADEGTEATQGQEEAGGAFELTSTRVVHLPEIGVLVFEQTTRGQAGSETPEALGQLDGAPVWGYVFATSLQPEDVGFAPVEEEGSVVALAVTSHPDFDDTPLWDEDRNQNYEDDGVVFHTHWVVLIPDEDSEAGLSVLSTGGDLSVLPPTAPGMPMYLDSPGFSVTLSEDTLRVVVPVDRLFAAPEFSFDAVTAKMNVDASGQSPVLRVNEVLDIASGDLSLPYEVEVSSVQF